MNNKLITLVLTILVGVILAGSLLVPVIKDTQTNIGSPVTFTNETDIVLREATPGDVLKCVSTYSDSARSDVWTLNDEAVSVNQNTAIISDGIYFQINNNTTNSIGYYVDMTDTTAQYVYLAGGTSGTPTKTTVITFGDENITVDVDEVNKLTAAYTWGYVVCPESDGEYCAAVSGGTAIVKSTKDVILCGNYTSGANDSPYYYHDGVTYIANSDYSIEVKITDALHANTTDVYDATVRVNVDDETFTPYKLYVPYKVVGHEVSNVNGLLGAIPVLVIVAILMLAVGAIAYRRAD